MVCNTIKMNEVRMMMLTMNETFGTADQTADEMMVCC